MAGVVAGARPRTLGAGLVPVIVGTAAAGEVIWWRFAAAALVAAGLQIGVNLANDYFDGVRGVDTHERVGPPRITQSGAASPRAVLGAALLSIAVAGFAGLALALATRPVLVLVVGALGDRRGVALQRRASSLRGTRARGGHGVRVLRAGRDVRHRVRDGRDRAGGRVVVRGRHGAARGRDPRGEQPPRHRNRRGRGEANARRASRRAAARALYERWSSARSARSSLGALAAPVSNDAVGLTLWGLFGLAPGCSRSGRWKRLGIGERTRPDPGAVGTAQAASGNRPAPVARRSCCRTTV